MFSTLAQSETDAGPIFHVLKPPREDRHIVTSSRGNRAATHLARDLQQATGTTIHPQTVRTWIYGNVKTDLVIVNDNLNAQQYCDEIIRPIVLPFMQRHPVFLFQ